MTPARPSDPPVRTLALARGPVSYTDEGEGFPVLAIHGLPGSARDFRWLGAAIGDRLRLVRVDLPGFGGTPVGTGPGTTPEARADVVVALAAALSLDRYVVLGHSMGGPVAAAVADRDPDHVGGLALIASVGVRPHRALRQIGAPRLLSWAFRVPPVRWAATPLLRSSMTRGGFRGHGDDALVHALHCVAGTSLPRHAATLARVRLPTLVAWAQDDPMVEAAIGEQLYWACPTGPRVRFPDGGHNLQKTRAIELSEALGAWIRQLG